MLLVVIQYGISPVQEALASRQNEGIFVGWSDDGMTAQNRVRCGQPAWLV